MKIYTRTGDDGTTGLFGGTRVAKDDPTVRAYGAVDEANAALGLARAWLGPATGSAAAPAEPGADATAAEPSALGVVPSGSEELDGLLATVQNTLFDVGADLATPLGSRYRNNLVPIAAADVAALEAAIDRWEQTLEPLSTFILPGGHPMAAALHLARTVVRRAEREVVGLGVAGVNPEVVIYLNRLSDLLFVLARAGNRLHGRGDAPWRKRQPGPDPAG